jgi:hypothetical protein
MSVKNGTATYYKHNAEYGNAMLTWQKPCLLIIKEFRIIAYEMAICK